MVSVQWAGFQGQGFLHCEGTRKAPPPCWQTPWQTPFQGLYCWSGSGGTSSHLAEPWSWEWGSCASRVSTQRLVQSCHRPAGGCSHCFLMSWRWRCFLDWKHWCAMEPLFKQPKTPVLVWPEIKKLKDTLSSPSQVPQQELVQSSSHSGAVRVSPQARTERSDGDKQWLYWSPCWYSLINQIVKSVCVILDSDLSFEAHMSKVTKIAFFHLRKCG